jgi:hypothetical protein
VAYRKPWARSWRRPLRSAPALALAGALAAVLPVASCTPAPAGSGAEGSASATGSASPAITAAQARQVWEHYVATAAKAVSPRLAAPELALVTGAERAVLSATLASHAVVVEETSNGAYSSSLSVTPGLSVYTYGAPAFYLPEAAGYPRFFVVSVARKLSGTKPTDNTSTTVGGATMPLDGGTLMLFTQARARAPWLLASTSQLSAGVAPPRLAADRAGYVPTVPLSDASLLAQPDDAGALQAAVVDDGQASAAAQAVADGPLTTGMYQGAVSHAGGLTAPPGDDYQWQLDGSSLPQFALRTAAGGALVFYAMSLDTTVAVPDVINKGNPIRSGPPIQVPVNVQALLPKGQAAPLVQLQSQQTLSFAAIDPAPGNAKIQVVAMGGGLTSASAS